MIDTPTCLGKKDGSLHDHSYRKKLLNQLISWTTNGNVQDLRYPTLLAYVLVYFPLSKTQWTLPVPTRLVDFLFCFYAKKKKKKYCLVCRVWQRDTLSALRLWTSTTSFGSFVPIFQFLLQNRQQFSQV